MPPKYEFSAEDHINKGLVTKESLDSLKSWWSKSGCPALSDEKLVLFLLACNNVLLETQKTMKAYYQCRNNSPELFDDRFMDCEDLKKATKCIECAVMPTRTKENYAVIFAKLIDFTYYNFDIESSAKLFFMCTDLTFHKNPPAGYYIILDIKGLGLMHLTRLKLGVLQKFFRYLQEGLPCQLKAIHVFNIVYFFDKLMAILRPFMKQELYEMIVRHRSGINMDDFFKNYIPADLIPGDYGGLLANQKILTARTFDSIREIEEFFKAEDEERRTIRIK